MFKQNRALELNGSLSNRELTIEVSVRHMGG